MGIWNAAGADDNSTGRRVSKEDREGEGGQGLLSFFFFFLCSGQAAIGPEAMNQRQRRDEEGDGGRTTKASSKEREEALWAGRRNVSLNGPRRRAAGGAGPCL